MSSETWLKEFTAFELEYLWKVKQKDEKSLKACDNRPLPFVVRERKRKGGGQGFAIRCKITDPSRRVLVYLVEVCLQPQA